MARRLTAAAALTAALAAASAQAEDNIAGIWSRVSARESVSDPRLNPPPTPDPPLKPEHQAAYKKLRAEEAASDARGEPIGNPATNCLPDGMPQMMFMIYPMEVIQAPGQVTIVAESFSQVRRILMDKPQAPIDEVAPGYFGRSVGHWEGDTLVVDTVGIKPSVRGVKSAPHSEQMRIVERIRRVAPDILQDEITVTDPKYLAGPWTWTHAYRRTPGYEMQEFVCENNRHYLDEKGVIRMRGE